LRSAFQFLLSDILLAKFGTAPFDYCAKGRGADRASDRLAEIMSASNAGKSFILTADIKDFYRSINGREVPKAMRLPKEVTANCIRISESAHLSLSHYDCIDTKNAIDCLTGAVRKGLPQGARTSQLIASKLLRSALEALAPADRTVSYADDLAIKAHGEQETHALAKTLIETLQSHPLGPFQLKHCDVIDIADKKGVDFLKYRHRLDKFNKKKIHRMPSPQCYMNFAQRVNAIWIANKKGVANKLIIAYRSQWRQAFPRWHCTWAGWVYLLSTTIKAKHAKFS
jgi:hypothetical protein